MHPVPASQVAPAPFGYASAGSSQAGRTVLCEDETALPAGFTPLNCFYGYRFVPFRERVLSRQPPVLFTPYPLRFDSPLRCASGTQTPLIFRSRGRRGPSQAGRTALRQDVPRSSPVKLDERSSLTNGPTPFHFGDAARSHSVSLPLKGRKRGDATRRILSDLLLLLP